MLLRYLALAILVLLVWYFLSRLLREVRRSLAGEDRDAVRGGRGDAGGAAPTERLLPCAACGVRVPESRMLAGGGQRYCSAECRRIGPGPAS